MEWVADEQPIFSGEDRTLLDAICDRYDLDSDHRASLVHHYFPVASHQVIILSTDTEVDRSYFAALRQDIAHAYRLEFDPVEDGTTITSGYFWKDAHETHEAPAL